MHLPAFLPRPAARTLYAATAVAALAAATFVPLSARAADLSLNVAAGPATEATLYIALYADAASFSASKPLASQSLPLREGKARVVFAGLPPGRYAVRAYADENGNGKLDTNLVGLPTERYGFSNDARGKLGAPDFEAAAIGVDADLQSAIHLR